MRRGVCAALSVLLLSTACFGRFELVRKVYTFNEDVSPDKTVRELVFLALAIVPIYAGAAFFDAIFANSVEFFTGKNPITTAQTFRGPDGSVATLTPAGDGVWNFTVIDARQRRQDARLVREANGFAAYDLNGQLLGRGVESGNQFRVVDAR